jgi:ankyrin repeat protein
MKIRLRTLALFVTINLAVGSGSCWEDPAVDKVIAQMFSSDAAGAVTSMKVVKNINIKSGGMSILLVYAMVPGLNDPALQRAIFSRNPDVETKDSNGMTALYHAAEQDKLDLITELLQRGANPNSTSDEGPALVGAASNARTRAALRLLEVRGLKVDLADRYGRTALLFASIHADSELLHALLQRGANPNIYEPLTGKTPLLWAASVRSGTPHATAAIAALLDNHANPQLVNPLTCDSAMHMAVASQNEDTVRALITHHVRADLVNSSGITPLGLARRLGNSHIPQLLTEALNAEHRNVDDTGNPPRDCHDPHLTSLARPKPQPKDEELPDQTPFARAVIGQWSERNHVVVNQKLAVGINDEMVRFFQIDCYKGNSASIVRDCHSLLRDKRRLAGLLIQDLDETFLEHKNPIPWFSARLSSAIGVDFTRAGYPMAYQGRNTTSCAQIPSQYGSAGGYLVNENTLIEIPANSRLCLSNGIYTVVLADKSRRLELRFNSSETPPVTVASVSSVGSRSDIYGKHVTVPANLRCLEETAQLSPATVPLSRRDDVSIPKPQLFSTAPVLNIEIRDSAHLCDSRCLADMRITVLTALIAWKSSCTRCSLANLMVIRFGQLAYVNTQTISILDGYAASNRPLPSPRERAPAAGVNGISYDLADPSLPKLASVCKSNTEQPFAELCGHSTAVNKMTLTIEISVKEETCRTENNLACASPDGVVQLRAKDHLFLVNAGEPGGPRFGKGDKAFDLGPVLIHEFGHFFGIPHIADQQTPRSGRVDAMTPKYDKRFCVSKSDATMLDQATDPKWPYKLDGCAGLHF